MVVKTDWLGRGLKAPRRILSKFSLFTVVYQNDFQFPILQKRLKEMAGEDSDTDDGNRKVSSVFFFALSGACLQVIQLGKPRQVLANLYPAR